MKARVLSEIQTPRGIIPAGQIITISDSAFQRLAGKVEPIHQAQPEARHGDTDKQSIVSTVFKCRACGGTVHRQGPLATMPRVCVKCQVPEHQHKLGRVAA